MVPVEALSKQKLLLQVPGNWDADQPQSYLTWCYSMLKVAYQSERLALKLDRQTAPYLQHVQLSVLFGFLRLNETARRTQTVRGHIIKSAMVITLKLRKVKNNDLLITFRHRGATFLFIFFK